MFFKFGICTLYDLSFVFLFSASAGYCCLIVWGLLMLAFFWLLTSYFGSHSFQLYVGSVLWCFWFVSPWELLLLALLSQYTVPLIPWHYDCLVLKSFTVFIGSILNCPQVLAWTLPFLGDKLRIIPSFLKVLFTKSYGSRVLRGQNG